MPGGDRTGPSGFGPMTGRGRGWCGGFRPAGWLAEGYGRAGAFGFGCGRGRWHGQYAAGPPGRFRGGGKGWRAAPGFPRGTAQEELAYLREYLASLEDELNAVKARMAELEGTEKTG
jgi:hypothetical protein